jgi:hypothetical protein
LPDRSTPSAFCIDLRGEAGRERAELRLRRIERLTAEREQAAERAARQRRIGQRLVRRFGFAPAMPCDTTVSSLGSDDDATASW